MLKQRRFNIYVIKIFDAIVASFFCKKTKNKMDIEQIFRQELEKSKLIDKLKKISKKPDLKIYVSKVDKRKRKRIALINLFARKSLKKNLKNVYGF